LAMAYDSLRDFIARLEKDGELVRVREPVSTVLEMTEIQTRLIAEGGPAVIFEKPITADGTPSDMPVIVNLFGTGKLVAMGVTRGEIDRTTGIDLREVGELLAQLRQPQPPRSFGEAAELLPLVKTVLAMKPKTVGKPACQEIVPKGDDIDLAKLPVMTCWPGEPAPLITWPLVVTKGPSDAREDNYNLGIYRMQVLNKNQTIMRWLKHRGGAQHHARWGKEKTAPLPAAAVIGADPGIILAAVTPVPDTLSEYQFAGLLRGHRVELVDCVTQPLKVPAEAEIVIEGEVSLTDYRDEGPYGDHTGYYNSVEQFPVFTATAVTMRRQQSRGIVDFWLPPEGGSYRIAVVAMKKAYPGHAKRMMMAVWSYLRQFMYTKWVIVVDDDINARDWQDVMWAISTRMDPARDVTLIENTPIDYLDFASPESGLGSKIGLDATNKLPPETHREWGKKIAMDEDVIRKVTEKWARLGLPGSGKQ